MRRLKRHVLARRGVTVGMSGNAEAPGQLTASTFISGSRNPKCQQKPQVHQQLHLSLAHLQPVWKLQSLIARGYPEAAEAVGVGCHDRRPVSVGHMHLQGRESLTYWNHEPQNAQERTEQVLCGCGGIHMWPHMPLKVHAARACRECWC